jgi:glucose-1-phosphate thymidylyltransferase
MRRGDAAAALTGAQNALADAGMKAMIPIGRPFLDYVLSGLADAGVRDVCLVIGPEHGRIRDYYERGVLLTRLRMTFAIQEAPRGTADALLAARDFAAEGPFLVLNADNYYPVDAYRALVRYAGPALPGFARASLLRDGNFEPARIRRFALLQVDADGFLADIVEKPDDLSFERMGEQALVSMNLWSFLPSIFRACERVAPSERGELELPGAVRLAVRELGERFRVLRVEGGVLDLSQRGDVATVAERLRHVAVTL